MYRILTLTLFASVLSLPSLDFQLSRSSRPKRNRAPIIKSFDASRWVVAVCPFVPGGACDANGTRVTLKVDASDPEDDHLTYQYTVSIGVIEGSGSIVNWDLNGAFGPQTATVAVIDRRGKKSSSMARVRVDPCGSCDPPRTLLEVLCPANVSEGETALFKASISGYDSSKPLIYLWSHSNGKRVPGGDESRLSVKAIGFPGDVITATVRVVGLDPTSSSEASCQTKIVKRVMVGQ